MTGNNKNNDHHWKRSLGVATSALGIIGTLFVVMNYFNNGFVSKDKFEAEQQLRLQHEDYMQTQFTELAEKIIAGHNLLRQDVNDAKAFSLVVRRDILNSRISLDPAEEAELRVINSKLRELNID